MEIRDDFMICHPKLGLNLQKRASHLMIGPETRPSFWLDGAKKYFNELQNKTQLKGNGFHYRHDYNERHEQLRVITIT